MVSASEIKSEMAMIWLEPNAALAAVEFLFFFFFLLLSALLLCGSSPERRPEAVEGGGTPSFAAVEASQPATASVSFLYC